ncbi:MAG: IPT/TIG domain-containing protein [Deltaproteobacteria bacterium]
MNRSKTFIHSALIAVTSMNFLSCSPHGSSSSQNPDFHPGISIPPQIISVSPSQGPTTGGTQITLTGTGFLSGTQITLDSKNCLDTQFISSSCMTCTTPKRSSGYVDIKVTNPDGKTSTLSNGFRFFNEESNKMVFGISNSGGIAIGTGVKMRFTVSGFGTPIEISGSGVKAKTGLQGSLSAR